MSTDLTPQQVIALLDSHLCLLVTYVDTCEEYHNLHAAIDAALDAYRREHMRRWLEEQGVSVVLDYAGWKIDPPLGGAVNEQVRYVLMGANEMRMIEWRCGWSTADAVREAAATALGYPGIGEV